MSIKSKESNITSDAMARKNLPEHIAQVLRDCIARKELNPGDKFPTELELIEKYGVSRSTVRETIKILRAENVIEIRRGVGTYISKNPGQVTDPLGLNYANKHKLLANLMETRMMIEPEIAFLAAERATQANLHKLGKILERMVRESGDHSRIDIEFHTAIAECTQNDVLGRILPIINESIYVGYTQTFDVPGSFEKAVEFHTRIFQAISRRDGELARHEIENHLRESMKDMKLV